MIIGLRLVVAVLVAGVVVGSGGGAMAASAQPGTGTVIVSKAVCEDDAQQGETDFQIESRNPPTEPAAVTGARAFQSSGTGERCTRPDGGYTFTLTTLDTGDARSRELTGGVVARFVGVAPGTYTVTEEPVGDLGEVSEPFADAAGAAPS